MSIERQLDLLLRSNLVIMRHLDALTRSVDLGTMIREIEFLRWADALADLRRATGGSTISVQLASGLTPA